MKKHGDQRDIDRRRSHISKLQDGVEWRKHRNLPPADAVWPTCLIIAPSTVVLNWEREFETASPLVLVGVAFANRQAISGVILKLVLILARRRNERTSLQISRWDV